MIQLRNLTLARAAKVLIEGASLQVHAGQKIGLTGANGSGKSSLFALLRGELHQEGGDVDLPRDWVIAHVAQETPALEVSALDFTLDGDAELREIERLLVAAEAADDGMRVAELHERLGHVGGYGARARAAELLHGLGFRDAEFAEPVARFSGGWRVRLNLARALMCRSDLLLLDEPTNHLDLDAIIWLERWLREYRGTMLLISHDRDFLDATVDHIAHIEQRQLALYRGGYSDFERLRAQRLASQQATYEAQQREIAHLHSYIDRFRAKATKARQAQSRIKALARMEEIAAAHVDTPFTFRFREPGRAPDPLLVIADASAGYGQRTVLSGITLTLRPGERVGLLGRNGAGKSTLVKLLAGELAPMAGERREGHGLAIGYFAQHQLEQLRPDESPLWHLQKLDPTAREQDLRDWIGRFDFRGEMASAQCGPFSGGEKSRLALALLIYRRPNLLLLDEPTNHLDLEMREALTLALAEYEGGVVLVSHDRHLLRTTVDSLHLVADGRLAPFDGDLDDYRVWLDQQRAAEGADAAESGKARRKRDRAAEAADRDAKLVARRPLVKELDALEKKLAGWQGEKTLLEARLVDPGLYAGSGAPQLPGLLKRQAELQQDIARAEERWLELQMALEEIGDV
ncbi:MAG TPA: ATP-binding cassette domain-containing protein [Rhodocyclaceae bacterium]|nr:ATP-binding cassette domain-containing protein [Rhodocyclaceae bacterium]HMV55153.1 ATP-binding cassette domain-containing protein [Rhodocyclaceae bacterium]HMZ83355.1 ATP-binding cassette domain-containing protein [Rhodocyclaceae bacterium]HNA03500.1 ATP-binding cassette domain-containing protein [Rhodocyclaceae bacterium]HNB79566.1 ATP-binding cassette domain-containing protein [Rhodocyclaceae bacterium]